MVQTYMKSSNWCSNFTALKSIPQNMPLQTSISSSTWETANTGKEYFLTKEYFHQKEPQVLLSNILKKE